MVTLVARRAALAVAINGSAITNMRSASWRAGFNQPYPEAHVVVPSLPVGFDQDQTLQIVAGNGTNNGVVRFLGRTRDPEYNLDGTITLRGVGQMEKAYTYENSEEGTDPEVLGLTLFDLIGADSGTDADVVKAVLTKVGVSYTAANIGGTGVTFGTLNGDDAAVYLWSSGDNPTGYAGDQGAGETALEYIARWDRVSAVHPGPFVAAGVTSANSPGAITAPVGFYRTFETLGGVVYRKLIGGRPRGTPEYTFTEGVDIRAGVIARKFPLANRFIAVGYDSGDEDEMVRFVMQSSSPPYWTSSVKHTAPTISSPMIEKTAENDDADGMSAEKVTYAAEPEFNRIIVAGTFTTGRDEPIGPGATILVQAPGGAPGRMGTGENVMVQAVSGRVDNSGYSVDFEILGGGVPDNFLAAVPQ